MGVFQGFLKLYKWYQIVKSITMQFSISTEQILKINAHEYKCFGSLNMNITYTKIAVEM